MSFHVCILKQWGHTPSTNLGGTWGEDDDVGFIHLQTVTKLREI